MKCGYSVTTVWVEGMSPSCSFPAALGLLSNKVYTELSAPSMGAEVSALASL